MARPIEFNRTQVLEKATNLFWENGYFATSMSRLVDTTELNPGSLYAAFNSKEGLLLAAIDHYGQRSLAKVQHTLTSASSPIEGIRDYLEQLTSHSSINTMRRGCFMVNTILEVAPHNTTVKEKLSEYLDAIEACFHNALQLAQAGNQLGADKDPEALAKFLMINVWGIRVMQRLSPPAQTLQAMAQQYLQLLEN